MSKLVIRGGKPLFGAVRPSGSKNAALPIIFATLLTCGTSVLYGVPDIGDVRVALGIIEGLGARCTRIGEALYINTESLCYERPRDESVCKIRASSYLLGACLSRFGVAHISAFGGCNFENRPIDMHLFAATAVGARIIDDRINADRLFGADIRFDKVSVGATVNALLLTVCAEGTSRIYGGAREPHVHSLISFLRTAGASIRVADDLIEVEGRRLHGGVVTVIPDMIEAGTYLALSLATRSDISVADVNGELSAFLGAVAEAGATVRRDGAFTRISGEMTAPCKIITAPHPGFPTDLQPQTAPVLALGRGGEITEGVWHSRFGYLAELERMGLKYARRESTAYIYPSTLHPAVTVAPDLRGGAALLIAALAVSGESVIERAELIDRGYEGIVEKLRAIGADIEKIP